MPATMKTQSQSLTDFSLLKRATKESFAKLDPRIQFKNPVMFVVEIGAVITAVVLIAGMFHHAPGFGFNLQITLWLWFTVLFANFAEAMAEGRGKAQAETLRKARSETMARRLTKSGCEERIPGSQLHTGDVVLVAAGEMIPGDGEIIEGIASVD